MQQKLSEIILEMIKPCHTDNEDPEYIENLIMYAIMAWNIALLPEKEAVESMELALKTHRGSRKQRETLRTMLESFINFKLEKHGSDDRFILEYEYDPSVSPQLIIASTSPEESALPPPVKPETGRNDPCPCGSGKKYKKCCGCNDS